MSEIVEQMIQDAMGRAVEYGVLRKAEKETPEAEQVMQLVPITLWPSTFPEKHYEFLLKVQKDYNILVNKLSSDVLLMGYLQW